MISLQFLMPHALENTPPCVAAHMAQVYISNLNASAYIYILFLLIISPFSLNRFVVFFLEKRFCGDVMV